MSALPNELKHSGDSEVKYFVNSKRGAVLLIAALTLIAIGGILYAYIGGNSAGTQISQNEIGDPATGCTSYQCINNVQWINNPLTGVKECRTC